MKESDMKPNTKSGFILISVMLMIIAMAAFILEFNYESRLALRIVGDINHVNMALNNADAGISIAMAALKQNENITSDTAQTLFSGMTKIPIDDGFYKVSITLDSGKININSLCTSDGKPIRKRVDQMLRLIDLLNNQYGNSAPISYGLVPAVIDWIDPDNDATFLPYIQRQNTGAENNYYKNLDEPYLCKDAPFDVLSELRLVKGMTSEIFYGLAGNKDKGIKPVDGISKYLTVYGEGKININEAPIIVIRSLSEGVSNALAQNIIEQREYSRYSSIEQLKKVPGMTNEIYEDMRDLITIKNNDDYYIVTGTGIARNCTRTVKVVLRKNQRTSQLDVVMRSEI